MDNLDFGQKPLVEGEPCGHPGCMSHRSHPCEKCGRIQGRDRTGLAQAKMMCGDAADRLEQAVNELRAGGAYVTRTWMDEDPKNPFVILYVTELTRPDGSTVVIRETLRKKKCPGYAERIGDVHQICINCGRPHGAH